MRTYCRTPILSFGDGDCTHELFNPDPIFTSRLFSSKVWFKLSSGDEINAYHWNSSFQLRPPWVWMLVGFKFWGRIKTSKTSKFTLISTSENRFEQKELFKFWEYDDKPWLIFLSDCVLLGGSHADMHWALTLFLCPNVKTHRFDYISFKMFVLFQIFEAVMSHEFNRLIRNSIADTHSWLWFWAYILQRKFASKFHFSKIIKFHFET